MIVNVWPGVTARFTAALPPPPPGPPPFPPAPPAPPAAYSVTSVTPSGTVHVCVASAVGTAGFAEKLTWTGSWSAGASRGHPEQSRRGDERERERAGAGGVVSAKESGVGHVRT